MREIKFRAWDKKAKRWIDDFIIRNNGQVETRQLDPDNIQVGYRYALGDVEVVQYTGLKDKNGTPIFEGDEIIGTDVHGNTDRGVVDYEPSEGAFVYRFTNPGTWSRFKTDFETYEVIGNVFSNPELLHDNK